MPLGLAWRFDKVAPLQRPTQADYDELVAFTKEWLVEGMVGDPLLSNINILALAKIETEQLADPAFDTTRDMPYNIPLKMTFYWQAGSVDDVPTSMAFIVGFSERFSSTDFIANYVPRMQGLFGDVSSVGYSSTVLGAITREQIVVGNPQPQEAQVAASPVTTTAAAATTAATPTTNTLVSSDDNAATVPVILKFGGMSDDQSPTPLEIAGLLAATQSFLEDSLQERYAAASAADVFVGVTMQWVKTAYNPADTFSHVTTAAITLWYDEGKKPSDTVDFYVFLLTDTFNKQMAKYIQNYVHRSQPVDSVYRTTRRVAFDFRVE